MNYFCSRLGMQNSRARNPVGERNLNCVPTDESKGNQYSTTFQSPSRQFDFPRTEFPLLSCLQWKLTPQTMNSSSHTIHPDNRSRSTAIASDRSSSSTTSGMPPPEQLNKIVYWNAFGFQSKFVRNQTTVLQCLWTKRQWKVNWNWEPFFLFVAVLVDIIRTDSWLVCGQPHLPPPTPNLNRLRSSRIPVLPFLAAPKTAASACTGSADPITYIVKWEGKDIALQTISHLQSVQQNALISLLLLAFRYVLLLVVKSTSGGGGGCKFRCHLFRDSLQLKLCTSWKIFLSRFMTVSKSQSMNDAGHQITQQPKPVHVARITDGIGQHWPGRTNNDEGS